MIRDLSPSGYGAWFEIEWCESRRWLDALWHPSRHRAKLVFDCISALMRTIAEMKQSGFDIVNEPQRVMVSVPYLALLNIANSAPCATPGAVARQFAIVEQKAGDPLVEPKLLLRSSAHELASA